MLQHRQRGHVKRYNSRKQYGFITSHSEVENNGNPKDFFVHRDDLVPRVCLVPYLNPGEYVEYDTVCTNDGRIKASNVRGIDQGPLMCDHQQQRDQQQRGPDPPPRIMEQMSVHHSSMFQAR